jgi:hypothetical protein
LVSQFATLASRLGISLPPDVLKSITESAGAGSASGEATTTQRPSAYENGNSKSNTAKESAKLTEEELFEANNPRPASVASSTSSGAAQDSGLATVDAVQKTAQDAVAAVTRKRSTEDSKPSTNGNGSDSNSNKASYTKRRKKARLSDCESRLEKLREENKLLKQHLDNVTSQTQRFDEERVKAEQTMKRMMESEGVSDDDLNAVIRDYTEMYSDYGKRRHQELSFHLEQLQK